MIIFIIILSNLFSSLVTFISTREVYRMDPNGDVGDIGLQHGMRTGHTDSAGHGMRTGQEGIYTGRAHGKRGKARNMSGTIKGIIDFVWMPGKIPLRI